MATRPNEIVPGEIACGGMESRLPRRFACDRASGRARGMVFPHGTGRDRLRAIDASMPTGPQSWDVIVVGAGIYGLPVGYFLARDGARVLVLEDNTIPGEGITVNTGGIIRLAYSDLD